jgi:capsular exopolysaccharide synthesis family protein
LNNENLSNQSNPQTAPGWDIDYKRILYRTVKYWYIVVLSVMIGLAVAFLYNRYATRIYTVNASVIVKESEDLSGGSEFLYNNPLVNFRRNYLNELYIIKSYPLIQKVIEDQNFDVTFLRQGNILTTEVYNALPFEARVLRERSTRACHFIFRMIDQRSFSLQTNDESESKKFNFGDTVRFNGLTAVFNLRQSELLDELKDADLIFTYVPSRDLAKSYSSMLAASWAEEGAGVVNLSIDGQSPAKAKDFMTGLIQSYQDFDLDNKNETASRTVTFISEQLEGISDSLRRVERQLEQFKDRNPVGDLSGEALRLNSKIETLEAQRAQLIINKNYYKHLTEYVQQNNNLDQIILPTSIGVNDPILTGLISRMVDMQLEIKMLGKKENPFRTDTEKRINETRKDIIESVRNLQSTDQIKLNYLQNQIRDAEKQLGYLPVAERRFVSIQRNYTLMENLYIFLLQRRSEAAISQASNTSDITLVNPPTISGPISPLPKNNYLIGLMAGIFLPMLAFVLQEIFDNRVQSKEDIEKITTIPFIGGVGHKKTENNLEVLHHAKTAIAESFRALRSNLNYFLDKKESGVFLITSSISGEGKTFASINLASVFALSGKRTLIIGADMRRPKIFADFGLKNDLGLSNFLAGLNDFNSVVQKTEFENLDLISGGPVPPNPSELLMNNRMNVLIETARKTYDYIIIDTPPLAIVTDAFVLAPFADHTLFMIRQNYTPKYLLNTAEEFYSTGKLKNISIVLNDIYRSGPGYGYGYGYMYGYGYGYQYGDKQHGYYENQ